MNEKVRIIQTESAAEGTVVSLADDVAQVEVAFDDRCVSRIVIKMKQE